jgi:hypothetical protein
LNFLSVKTLPTLYIPLCAAAPHHFARQEWEVHVVRGHEEGIVRRRANKRLKLIKLILGERPSPEFHRKVGLRTRLGYKDRIIPAFVNTFDQNLEVFGASYG